MLYRISVSGTINRENSPLTGGTLSVVIYDPPVDTPEPDETIEIGSFTFGEEFTHVLYRSFEDGRYISLDAIYASLDPNQINSTGNVTFTIEAVTGNTVDFEEAFIDFGIQAFMNEILWRFSLTPFKDKYRNHIQYLTSAEWLQNTERVDWSASQNKYISQMDESYVLSGYAQRNYLRYKYDDDNFNHNDGLLEVENRNIESQRNIISSNLFSPEPENSIVLGQTYNIYKFWDREPQDSGEIKYKELNNRFYIMRSQRLTRQLLLQSEIGGEQATVSSYDRETFNDLGFNSIVSNYYRPLFSILNSARLVTANIYLNDLDIANIDFRKLYYIREQGSYFIINRIPNYIDAGVYRVQLLEVDLNAIDPNENTGGVTPSLSIQSVAIAPSAGVILNWSIQSNVTFINYIPDDGVIVRAEQLDALTNLPTGVVMNGDVEEGTGIQVFQLPIGLTPQTCGNFRMTAIDPNRNFTSDPVVVNVPCPTFVGEEKIVISVVNGTIPQGGTSPITRTMLYRFENFTPSSAQVTVQRIEFNTENPIGSPTTTTLTTLTPDVDNSIALTFSAGSNLYKMTIVTNTLTEEYIQFVL